MKNITSLPNKDIPEVIDDIEKLPISYVRNIKTWKEVRHVDRQRKSSYEPEGKERPAKKKSRSPRR